MQLRLAVAVDQPYGRFAEVLGERGPRQFNTGLGRAVGGSAHYRTQLHALGQRLQGDLHLHGTGVGRHGRRDFTHLAHGLDARVIQEADGDRRLRRRLHQQRLIDVEHRIALAIARQAEDRHGGLHYLADFCLARGNHSRCFSDQRGIAELFAGVGQLGLGGGQGTLAAAQRGLGGIVFAAAGVALGQELFLAHEGGGRLFDPRLLGHNLGLGGIDVGLQVFGIELGQHLLGADAIAHVHHALDDLAAHTEGQIGLHTGLDIAGQRDCCGKIRRLHGLHEYPRVLLGLSLFLATAAQQRE